MLRNLLVLSLFFGVIVESSAQKPTVFKTVFKPFLVTYNASRNPNLCVEAVSRGITIKIEKSDYFFSVQNQPLDILKEKLTGKEVEIEVIWWEEHDVESGLAGNVKKITFEGEIVYKTY